MKKKLLLCVICVLLLSQAGPACAAENSYTTTINALCNLPEISVVVPTTAEVFINPYRLPIEIASTESTAQIVSTPAAIENKSEVPLSITAAVTGTVREGSNMRLSTSSTVDAGLTSKRAFVYLEMQAASDPDQVNWDDAYDAERHLIVRAGTTKAKKNIVAIAQGDKAKHFGAFRLTGDCVPVPKGGWTDMDGIDVEIVFTFTPLPVWTEIS